MINYFAHSSWSDWMVSLGQVTFGSNTTLGLVLCACVRLKASCVIAVFKANTGSHSNFAHVIFRQTFLASLTIYELAKCYANINITVVVS